MRTVAVKILMLDRNYLIDRRIVLEAKSLISAGHEVVLAALRKENDPFIEKIDTLKVIRFFPTESAKNTSKDIIEINDDDSLNTNEKIKLLRLKIYHLCQKRVENRIRKLIKNPKLVKLVFYLFYPTIAVENLPSAKLPQFIKLPLTFFYTFLTFSPRKIMDLLKKTYEKIIESKNSFTSFIAEDIDHNSRIRILRQKLIFLQQQRNEILMINIIKNPKIARLFSYTLYPSIAVERLPYTQLPKNIKTPLMIFYSFLTLSPKKIVSLVKFIVVNAKNRIQLQFLSKRTASSKEQLTYEQRSASKELFSEYWSQEVVSAIEKFIYFPDVIHAHDYPSLPVGVALGAYLKRPVIYDAHELYSYQPGIPKILAKKILKEEGELVKQCVNIVVVNKDQAAIMQKDFNFNYFTTVTNATEEPAGFDINKKYDLIREKTGIPQSHKILLFQGGINRLRKIDLLLEGVAQVPDNVHMAFLTYGMEIPEFKELARKLGIRHRTHFLEPVPSGEIVYWAASADVGIMPYQPLDQNTTLSLPNKMYEFIAAGVPMIASIGLVNVRKIIEGEGFGVLRDLRVAEDYAAAIREMFDETLGGCTRFRNSLLKRREAYMWKNEEKALLDLYRDLNEQSTISKNYTVQHKELQQC